MEIDGKDYKKQLENEFEVKFNRIMDLTERLLD